jgi:HlyD family secretion protein
MSKKVKWSILGVAVAGVVAVVALTAAKRDGKATEVRIEQVARQDLVASVTASGQVQPQTKVDLSADITGRIVRLAVKEGDMVTKGQFLLEIDPQQYQAAVQRNQAALASARAEQVQARVSYDQALKSYERMAEIKKANSQLISDEQLDQLRTDMEVKKAAFEAAEFRVAQSVAAVRDAQWSLSRTTISAPMSGRITRLNVESGETAIMGTLNKDAATLLTIADMSTLETKVKVDETDVARIKLGDSAVVQIDAFPDTTFTGRVTAISNSSVRAATTGANTDQAVDYEVTIQLLNAPADTRPDFSATAKVVTDTRQQVLAIPIIALTVRENEPVGGDTAQAPGAKKPAVEVGKRDTEGVFVVGADNKVTFRPVRVGIAGDRYFEVLSGLEGDERIVGGTYQAIRELKDGTIVREAPTPKPQVSKS